MTRDSIGRPTGTGLGAGPDSDRTSGSGHPGASPPEGHRRRGIAAAATTGSADATTGSAEEPARAGARAPKDGSASSGAPAAGRGADGGNGIVLRHQVAATVQAHLPGPLEWTRPGGVTLAPPADQVLGNPPRHRDPAVEQQVHLVFARLARVRDRAGRGRLVGARSTKGLSRSRLTVGLQSILRGNASV